ncbi:MAG: PEP-utilizing enzyme, partial [Candidatus Hydrogenedentota bacterium]
GRHPVKPDCVAVEAVHGINQGLVDGTVAPDRWTLDRRTGELVEFDPAERKTYVALSRDGVEVRMLPKARANRPPLSDADLRRVYALAMQLGEKFETPQDVEWTFRRSRLYLLQSRAITTAGTGEGDKRAWYLSLRRSVDNLIELRERIENDLIPKMDEEARRWEEVTVHGLSDGELLAEVVRRYDRYQHWLRRYWDECIPFAHGVRLFGQFYNDAMQPEDPYEFVELLSGSGLLSVKRNEDLRRLAARAQADERLLVALKRGEPEAGQESFWTELDAFGSALATEFGEEDASSEGRKAIAALLLQMAEQPSAQARVPQRDKSDLEKAFLAKFRGKKRKEAEELLELGRSSYRLRDDDNVYLGRIAHQVDIARDEAKRRRLPLPGHLSKSLAMRPTGGQEHAANAMGQTGPDFEVRARQLTGQPAGPGLGSGSARVIRGPQDLFAFESGEVLVCDAVDPTMSVVMPLAGAIVECRGGMLVHGAIIAREYGIPCVTGVQDALGMIATGARVQVDGYLGIVTIG